MCVCGHHRATTKAYPVHFSTVQFGWCWWQRRRRRRRCPSASCNEACCIILLTHRLCIHVAYFSAHRQRALAHPLLSLAGATASRCRHTKLTFKQRLLTDDFALNCSVYNFCDTLSWGFLFFLFISLRCCTILLAENELYAM